MRFACVRECELCRIEREACGCAAVLIARGRRSFFAANDGVRGGFVVGIARFPIERHRGRRESIALIRVCSQGGIRIRIGGEGGARKEGGVRERKERHGQKRSDCGCDEGDCGA